MKKNEPRQLTQSAVLVIYKLAEAVRHFRAISSEGERHLDTVEVTGSIPVSPTTCTQARGLKPWPVFVCTAFTGEGKKHAHQHIAPTASLHY